MKFVAQPIAGAFVVESEAFEDERGSFYRAFCSEEFAAVGLEPSVVQTSVSRTRRSGTIRGIHWQREPYAEAKLVRCLRGRIWDVMVDVRPDSKTFGRWHAVELSETCERGVYLPQGVAHGFQTLSSDVVIYYQMSAPFTPSAARGLCFDDSTLRIPWPLPEPLVSDKDRQLPCLSEQFPSRSFGND